MLDTLKIFNELKEKFDPESALKLAEIFGTLYGELANTVTKTDFNDLKSAFHELIEAQVRTEKRLDSLAQKIEALSEAQVKTEKRLNELAEAQTGAEKRLDSLTQKVENLAEAQKRTEESIKALIEAQKKSEKRFNQLDKRLDDLQKQVGGISNTLGYSLENSSYKAFKKILPEKFGIHVDKLYRRNLVYESGKFDEINIYGEGKKNNHKVYIIGESKAQFGLKDVKQFLKLLERVKKHLQGDVFPLALAHQFHPKAEENLKKYGIPFFWSYEVSDR